MLIDWFTVFAQLVNFVILVWLLKHFLYQPILKAIAERERLITGQIEAAGQAMADAKKEMEDYQQKNSDFEHKRQTLLSEAKKKAHLKREELIKEANQEFDTLRSRFRKSLEQEQQQLNNIIVQKIAGEVFAITRKILEDLASIRLEEHITETFADRLYKTAGNERRLLIAALKASTDNLVIESAFEVPKTLQTKIRKTVKELVPGKVQIKFRQTPDQIAGIELLAHNYKVSWSIANYLQSLEKGVGEALKGSTFH